MEAMEKIQKEKAKEADTEENISVERRQVDKMRGTPLVIGTLEEWIDDNHGIVSS